MFQKVFGARVPKTPDPLYERSGEKTTKHQLPQKTTEFSIFSKLTENLSYQRDEKRF